MKKTAHHSRSKLALRAETIRTLTRQDLQLVVGGACKHHSEKSQTRAPGTGLAADGPRPDITTC